MAGLTRTVELRLDSDVLEVRGGRVGRERIERFDIGAEDDPFATLEAALQSSPLLRPGRRCEVRLRVESSRTIYRTVQGERECRSSDGEIEVVLPDGLREVLEPILLRRRVHGSATLAAGPAGRALDTLRARARSGGIGRGFIVDRSAAAVTVMLIDGATIRWARGAPADDATEAAAALLRRAAEVVNGAYGLHFWHLDDVAAPIDDRQRRRESRELEARCHALIGHLPRMATSTR
jgi:hypothetical protein